MKRFGTSLNRICLFPCVQSALKCLCICIIVRFSNLNMKFLSNLMKSVFPWIMVLIGSWSGNCSILIGQGVGVPESTRRAGGSVRRSSSSVHPGEESCYSAAGWITEHRAAHQRSAWASDEKPWDPGWGDMHIHFLFGVFVVFSSLKPYWGWV